MGGKERTQPPAAFSPCGCPGRIGGIVTKARVSGALGLLPTVGRCGGILINLVNKNKKINFKTSYLAIYKTVDTPFAIRIIVQE